MYKFIELPTHALVCFDKDCSPSVVPIKNVLDTSLKGAKSRVKWSGGKVFSGKILAVGKKCVCMCMCVCVLAQQRFLWYRQAKRNARGRSKGFLDRRGKGQKEKKRKRWKRARIRHVMKSRKKDKRLKSASAKWKRQRSRKENGSDMWWEEGEK